MTKKKGYIIKGIAGFYYVHDGENTYECKAKGVFRKEDQKPLVGDMVEIDVLDEEKKKGNIVRILPRRNELIRPAVANIDQALVVFALAAPAPSLNLLDRFLLMMEKKGLPCLILLNKADLVEKEKAAQIAEIYRNCGYPVFVCSMEEKGGDAATDADFIALQEALEGKVTTLAGPSGVGKSTLTNLLQKDVQMETGSISAKTERGKHTTRHAQLIALSKDTYLFDTPGFSSLELFSIEKEELSAYYHEFAPFALACKFGSCAHIGEPICGVKEALDRGEISKIRYENYKLLYEECKNRKKY